MKDKVKDIIIAVAAVMAVIGAILGCCEPWSWVNDVGAVMMGVALAAAWQVEKW